MSEAALPRMNGMLCLLAGSAVPNVKLLAVVYNWRVTGRSQNQNIFGLIVLSVVNQKVVHPCIFIVTGVCKRNFSNFSQRQRNFSWFEQWDEVCPYYSAIIYT